MPTMVTELLYGIPALIVGIAFIIEELMQPYRRG